LLIKIHIHSSLDSLFSSSYLEADLTHYIDIMRYFSTMHPRFVNYIRQQDSTGLDEGYALLDKSLNVISSNDLLIKRFKDGDELYIVPAIIGGGGKRGGLLALAALAAVFVVAPAAAPALAQAGLPGAQAFVATSAKSGLFAAIKGSSFLSSIVANVGLALLSALFMKKPDTADTNSRNNMFGSLKNTTESGTPIPMHYGLVRVAGQFISGYIQTTNHSKGALVSVDSLINSNSTYAPETPSNESGLTNVLLTSNGSFVGGWVLRTIDLSTYQGALVRAVFKTVTTDTLGIAIDTITLGTEQFVFEDNNEDFESDSNVNGTSNYTDISWNDLSTRTSFTRSSAYHTAQSGNFYIRAAQPLFSNNVRTVWARTPPVVLGENALLTFYENRELTDNTLEVYLDVVW